MTWVDLLWQWALGCLAGFGLGYALGLREGRSTWQRLANAWRDNYFELLSLCLRPPFPKSDTPEAPRHER